MTEDASLEQRLAALEKAAARAAESDQLRRDLAITRAELSSTRDGLWRIGAVAVVAGCVLGIFLPLLVTDDESSNLLSAVFSILDSGDEEIEGETLVFWFPLLMMLLTVLALAVLFLGLAGRKASDRHVTASKVVAWILLIGSVGLFMLLALASTRSNAADGIQVLPPALISVLVAGAIAAAMTHAADGWVRDHDMPGRSWDSRSELSRPWSD